MQQGGPGVETCARRTARGGLALNAFHSPRRISRLFKHGRQQTFRGEKRLLRNTVAIMALVQTHHNGFKADNVICLSPSRRGAAPIGQVGALIEHANRRVFQSLRRQWTQVAQSLAQWLAQRRAQSVPAMLERARQRRELERLSDRELRDIGITRYEIEFVLRQSTGIEGRG
jgi:uncharacterized protein YjiS (DUF1127 family)